MRVVRRSTACMLFVAGSMLASADAIAGLTWTQATAAAGYVPRLRHSSVVFDGRMWVLGGEFSGWLSDVWYSTNGSNWTRATPSAAWGARRSHTSVTFGGRMWLHGGIQEGVGYTNEVWSSTDGAAWQLEVSNAGWSDRITHASDVYGGRMWVIGGSFGARFRDVWYSTNGSAWTQATSVADWPARESLATLDFDGRLWVLGGNAEGFGDVNDAWWSTDGVAWTESAGSAGWSGRSGHTSLSFGGRMWVIGGGTRDVWYSTDGASWTQDTATAAWTSRREHTSVVFNNTMWVIGGSSGGGEVWFVDPDGDADGVPDSIDECLGTPLGEAVNPQGCSCSQLDEDGDTVNNCDDACPGLDDTLDCNGNASPDCVDIAQSISEDCDESTVPDECELSTWIGADGGAYSAAANWDSGVVPSTNALIQNTGAGNNRCILGISQREDLCGVTIEGLGSGAQILMVNADSILHTTRELSVLPGGVLRAMSTSRVLAGGLGVSIGGEAEVRSLASLWSESSINNASGGRVTLLAGTVAAPSIVNESGGLITGFGVLDGDVLNEGEIATVADTQILGDLVNNGTITVQSGLLTVIGNLSGSGVIVGGFGN